MMNRQQFYINGQWVESATIRSPDAINPAREAVRVMVARGAFPGGFAMSRTARREMLRRIPAIDAHRSDETARAIVQNGSAA